MILIIIAIIAALLYLFVQNYRQNTILIVLTETLNLYRDLLDLTTINFNEHLANTYHALEDENGVLKYSKTTVSPEQELQCIKIKHEILSRLDELGILDENDFRPTGS